MTDNTTTKAAGEGTTVDQPSKGIKVFIIDDDKFLVDMYSLKFRKAGYDIDFSCDPSEALKRFRDGYSPDIVLSDVTMPSMTGLELLEVIRKEKLIPNTKIIMLTNEGMANSIEKAKSLNVDGYIVKASTIPSEVVAEVERICVNKNK